jgi:hypothetical protein
VTVLASRSGCGARPPVVVIRFQIDYGHDDVVATRERVMIMAGWG